VLTAAAKVAVKLNDAVAPGVSVKAEGEMVTPAGGAEKDRRIGLLNPSE
jgi:hypothetical protein